MFLADNNTSPEIIFAVPQDGLHTQSYGGTTFLVHASVGGSMNANAIGIDGGWCGTRARPELVGLFAGGAGGPDRRSAVFYTPGQTLDILNLTNFNDGYGVNKYENVTSTGAPGQRQDFVDTDYPMFRLADAYLIYAEANLRGGGGTAVQALAYVNALRTRAYGDATGNITAAQLTLQFIIDERGRELFWGRRAPHGSDSLQPPHRQRRMAVEGKCAGRSNHSGVPEPVSAARIRAAREPEPDAEHGLLSE